MFERTRNIVIAGSTGSIGSSTLDVVAHAGKQFNVMALSAHTRLDALIQQAITHKPDFIIATDVERAEAHDWSRLPPDTRLLVGAEQLERIVGLAEVDTVVAAIVGVAGLRGTWAAIEAGKVVALANKETLVAAGSLAMARAKERGATIIPIDSEHSAILQCLQSGRRDELSRIVLTASGGPFRQRSLAELSDVTVDEALAHPTWQMGPKITVDSATLMNKALEIIEARWLFDLQTDQIGVTLHPQSIVHSLVEFVDGSVIAQLSPPDMRLPIQYALNYPRRAEGPARKLDWSQSLRLEFEPPDYQRFEALQLGLQAARDGGTVGVVMNAANEAAVQSFLDGELGFADIVSACRSVVEHHEYDPSPTLDQLMQLDGWAREEVARWVCT